MVTQRKKEKKEANMKGGPRFSLRARGTVLTSRILKVRERCRLALSARVPWKKKKGGGRSKHNVNS